MAAPGSFHRTPRVFPPNVGDQPVVIAPPPQKSQRSGGTLAQALLSVLGMAGMVVFAVVSPNRTFLIVSIAFVVLMLMSSLGTYFFQRRSGKISARTQHRLYRTYLIDRGRELEAVRSAQRAADERLYPATSRFVGLVAERRSLWERRASDPDFLTFRFGAAAIGLAREPELELSEDPMVQYDPALLRDVQDLIESYRTVGNLSALQSLDDVATVTVTGPRPAALGLVRGLIAQAAIFRSPADLRLLARFDSAAQPEEWSWCKWLPHARGANARPELGDDSVQATPKLLFASDEEQLESLLAEHVQPRIEQLRRLESTRTEHAEDKLDFPTILLVFDGYDAAAPFTKLPLVRELTRNGPRLRIHTIAIVDPGAQEPPEAQLRVEISDDGTARLQRTGLSGYDIAPVTLDTLTAANAERLARELAPLRLEERAAKLDPAADFRLESLLEPEPGLLATPIGVTSEGERLVLDLKQAADGGMGPHGLIIGATGSGKSELLRTLVAGLALHHSPTQLNFVFVDFKGGAAFAELSQLPHTAGLITNLQQDLTLVDRMYQALNGEINRRQNLLRSAGNVDDIGSYQRQWQPGGTLPAMPYLLLIVDEFGELLASRPEFIDLFLTVGRVGRSLGIHLLLSSQRLDEGRLKGLEGHLRYRIALRTYSAQESKTVLGTSDAFLLPPYPGLGYLSVDTEVYEQFKAALVTRPHRNQGSAASGPVVHGFEMDSQRRQTVGDAGDSSAPAGADVETDLDVLIAEQRQANATKQGAHQVWLAPLPDRFALSSVSAPPPWWQRADRPRKPGLQAAIGILDLPAEQRQEPLLIDLSGTGGHLAIVGAPQSGKSTTLRTALLALMNAYTPDELWIYGLDFGGGSLRGLLGAPHVGGVAGKSEAELLASTVHEVRRLIAAREQYFREHAIDSMAEIRSLRAGGELPAEIAADVLLVIDNWAAALRDHDQLLDVLAEVAITGLNVGVHLIIAAGRWGEIKQNVRDAIGSRMELRLNDPVESDIGRRLAEAIPSECPGRGMIATGAQFQIALPRCDGIASTEGLGAALADHLETISGHWSGTSATPIRMLPDRLTLAELPSLARGSAIGLEELTLVPAVLALEGEDQHLLILGDPESGRTETLRTIATRLATEDPNARFYVVDFRRGLSDLAEWSATLGYASRSGGLEPIMKELRETCVARVAALDGLDADQDPGWDPVYVLVDDYDLVAGVPPNALSGLAELIFAGRDASMHVIISRPMAGAGRALIDPVIARLVESGAPVLLLSGDPYEGQIVRGARARQLPPGRGQLVRRRGAPTLIQLALTDSARADRLGPSGRQ